MSHYYHIYPGSEAEREDERRRERAESLLSTPPPPRSISPYPPRTPEGVYTQVQRSRNPLAEIPLHCNEKVEHNEDEEEENSGRQSDLTHLFPQFHLQSSPSTYSTTSRQEKSEKPIIYHNLF